MEPEFDQREALLRIKALLLKRQAAYAEMNVAAYTASKAMRSFIATWVQGERADFESHPDVQEVVVQMDGYYGDT